MSEPTKLIETDKPTAPQNAAAETMIEIDISHIQTENDAPVDSLFAEREGRLLVSSLYASWKTDQPFLACENVGVFYGLYLPPIVPDVFLSLDATPPQGDLAHEKRRRSYFVWEYGKPPDVVVEILSPNYGGEFDEKMKIYARIGVRYYVIHDPALFHAKERLSCYELRGRGYEWLSSGKLAGVGLEVRLWSGKFEDMECEWLRWYDESGNLLLTGAERAERLAVALRKLGVDPDKI